MLSEKTQDVEDAFDSSLVFIKLLLNTYGFWPYDIKSFQEAKGFKDLFFWGLRRIVLVTNAIFLSTEIMFIFLVAEGEIIPTVECIITLVALTFYTAVTYILFYRGDRIIYIINTLRSYTDLPDKSNLKMFKETSPRMKLLSYVLYITTGICIFVYVGIPLWLAYKEQHKSNSLEIIQRPLPFHSWYPYNQNEDPFYQISMVLEFFRGIGMLHVVTGYDSLFALILFYTCGQYDVLKYNFENIFQTARENLNEENEQKFNEEINRLLKAYIRRHIALNDLCVKEEEVYNVTIFIHLFLHSLILCSVVYLMLISIDTNDYWNFVKFLTFKMLLIIELFMYGYIGTKLIHSTTSLGEGCFHSEWHQTSSKEFKSSLQIIMHRSQTPCVLTGLKFSILSLEIVLTILSSSYSYFTLLNTVN